MKRKHLLTIILIIAFSLSATSGFAQKDQKNQPAEPELPEHVPGELLIRFSPGFNAAQVANEMAQMGLAHKKELPAIQVHLVKLPQGLSVEEAMARFSQRPGVEFAEPNYILSTQAPTEVLVDVYDQWALDKIAAPAAWSVFGTEPSRPLLAIVDTGITPTNPDLENNIWVNTGETGPDGLGGEKSSNGIDDDGNGYIDDWQGWDFVNNDNQPLDDQMHGTAVASVAAAEDNEIGIAGVCPWCQLVGVKALDANGSGSLDIVANGITYAAQIGARVINLSLGATATSDTLGLAVANASSAGALVVAAAGNNGIKTLFYPAAYPEAMAVASTGEGDNHSCFSNYYPDFISVSAPGEAVVVADINNQDTGYGYYSGTSLSAPHVTGLAGLLFSQNSLLTNLEVRQIIEDSAVDLGPPGFDDAFGHGRIDAFRAVDRDYSATTPPDGLFSADETATGYAFARKLVRVQGEPDTLHMIWHTREAGPNYRVRYATSTDDGATWNLQGDVFSSANETYHPALATDGAYLYATIPSKTGPEANSYYQIMFTRKMLPDGDWETALPIMGGDLHTVRPTMYFDPSNGRLHVLASGFDSAPVESDRSSDLYYIASDDQGANWGPLRVFNPSGTTYKTRYATLHANGDSIYVVTRTINNLLNIFFYYYMYSVDSTDGGATWSTGNQLSSYMAMSSGEYGISLAGVGDRMYMGYEVGTNMYFRRNDGNGWGGLNDSYLELETGHAETDPGNPLNSIAYSYKWPTITQSDDGQAWLMFEEHKDSSLYGSQSKKRFMRHYDGSNWSEAVEMGSGTYANFKLGTSADRVEWVATQCNGSPFMIKYDWTAVEQVTPTPISHHIPLVPGWNLVSFKVQPADTAIEVVLASIAGNYDLVYAWNGAGQNWQMYDPAAPAFSNTLQNLDHTRGFWIHATFPIILTVNGTPQTTTDIPLYAGWNLVGYPANTLRDLPAALQDHGVGTNFSMIYAYDSNDSSDPWKLFDRAAPPYSNDLTALSPGLGYWITATAAQTWTVDYAGP